MGYLSWNALLALHVIVFVTACVISATSADDDELPFNSQFPADAIPRDRSRPWHGGEQFQFLHIDWIRQEQHPDTRTVSVQMAYQWTRRPYVVWFINGRMIGDSDFDYPQWSSYDHGHVHSINISNTVDVFKLQLLISLETIEIETEIHLQDLDTGKIILEHGTDLALALDLQENVTVPRNDDFDVLARFYSEDMSDSTFDRLHVLLVRDSAVLTPELDDEIVTLWVPEKSDVPASLWERFDSPLSRYYKLRVSEADLGGTVVFTAEYHNTAHCRLFGGQKITRKVFLAAAA